MEKKKFSSAHFSKTALACLVGFGLSEAAFAGCDIASPVSNQTVTCTAAAPNPSSTGANAVIGSDNVTVNIDTGTILNLSDQNGVLIYSNSSVLQRGALNISNDSYDGLSTRLSGNILQNFGIITTQGVESEGIYIAGASNQAINQPGGQITTSGDDSSGMISFGALLTTPGNNTLTNAGSITTSGIASAGMFAQGTGNQLSNSGTLITTGEDASGMQGNGDGNRIDNSGTVITQGRAANAINSGGGTALGNVINSGTLTTSGLFANGVYFDDAGTFTNTATGSITSTAARGVLATAGGTLTNNGVIHAGRDGIDSYFGLVTVTNTGSVTSDNERAVHFDSDDNATLINSGNLTGNGVAVQFLGGNDTFIWQNSGNISGSVTMGAGDDSASLINLNDARLAAMPVLDGGEGNDQLTLDHAQLSQPSRFIDWESLLLKNASQLTLNAPLVMGDAQTHTGSVSIDPTSVLLTGGQSDAGIYGFDAGSNVSVINAGMIDLTGAGNTATSRLTISGNYTGNNGILRLNTVLNGDDSASDRLVISGGQADGNTQIQVINVGGTGAATLNHGIMLVEALNGATTTPGAFTLAGGSVSAGAYEYLLFRGSSDDAQGWYLRNSLISPPVTSPPVTEPPTNPPPVTPPTGEPPADPPVNLPPVIVPPVQATAVIPLYRQEAPLYQAVAPVAQQIGIHQLGTFHDRQGQVNTQGEAAGWARTFGIHSEQSWTGATSPAFDGNYAGLQVGQDLLAGAQDNAGVFYGFTRAKGNVKGFITGHQDAWAGNLTLEGNSAGAYWTHHWDSLAYLDAVIVHTWLNGSTSSGRGVDADIGGKLLSGSLEAGYPVPVSGHWSLEPQAQFIAQRLNLDNSSDSISTIHYSDDTTYTGRIGARLQGNYGELEKRLQPFVSVNLWHDFNATNTVTLGDDNLNEDQGSTALEVGVGVAASLSREIELYSAVSHTNDDDSEHRQDLSGNVGVKIIW